MVDISHTPALGYMEIVAQRDAATLLPIINAHVAPGTEVWSDEWSAYRRVGTLPNVSRHMTVNHSVNFVDPVTGVHTQHIESYWNRVKQKLKRMKGCSRAMLSGYLDGFMWKERYGSTRREAFDNLCGILPCIERTLSTMAFFLIIFQFLQHTISISISLYCPIIPIILIILTTVL